jgi:hypothetical protein
VSLERAGIERTPLASLGRKEKGALGVIQAPTERVAVKERELEERKLEERKLEERKLEERDRHVNPRTA